MKKTEIASHVFDTMDGAPLTRLGGDELVCLVSDLAGLALVPWFCDLSVQWAVRITKPGGKLTKTSLKKVANAFVSVTDGGALLAGVPGDGIEPSMYTLVPLADAIADAVEPGMTLELAAANLGTVKRDRDAKAETSTTFGDHRYRGVIDAERKWRIMETTPALSRLQLRTALESGRMVAHDGPYVANGDAEARAVLTTWLCSEEANVNPMAVKAFIKFKDGVFVNSDPGMTRKLCGLGLGFFRERLAGGPFRWPAPGVPRTPAQVLEEVARAVLG